MSRRDFFQLFCMFYLRLINRKCAKEKKQQYLMLYQTWNRTSVYFKLAISASYTIQKIQNLKESFSQAMESQYDVCIEDLFNQVSQLSWIKKLSQYIKSWLSKMIKLAFYIKPAMFTMSTPSSLNSKYLPDREAGGDGEEGGQRRGRCQLSQVGKRLLSSTFIIFFVLIKPFN